MDQNKKKAILIGAGDLDGSCFTGGEADMVIVLDGGLVFCEKNGITPDYIIGDFDSLPPINQSLLTQYQKEQIMRLPCEKDDTDMLAAIKFAMEKGITEFEIHGGLGGRLSHTIANIQCLMYLKEHGMKGVLVGKDTKVFLLQNESYIFDIKNQGYLSVFSYSGSAEGITLKGLKYELEDAALTNAFPLGVSNEFVGKEAEITVKSGTLLIVMDR